MVRKHQLFPGFLCFFLFVAFASAGSGEEQGTRFLKVPGGGDSASRVWIKNLGDGPVRVTLANADEISLAPREIAAAPEAVLAKGGRVRSGGDILVIRGDAGLSPSSLEVEEHPAIQLGRERGRLLARYEPGDWLADLKTAIGSALPAGQTVRGTLDPAKEPKIALALLDADSAVNVTVRNDKGRRLRSFTLAATAPVRLRVDLGDAVARSGETRVEVLVVRGRAATTLGDGEGPDRALLKSCTGNVNAHIHYNSGDVLYYDLSGCPASTCGELDTFRNGSWLFSPGWACTDASGSAHMGPWTWTGTASDQTDDPLFIRFSSTLTTNNDWHIWDKNPATAFLDSSTSPAPPTSYYGHATDTQWGAGFDFGAIGFSYFQDLSSGNYFSPFTSSYSSSSPVSVSATLSRVNQWYVNWSTVFPPSGAHTSHHNYEWITCVTDGNSGYCSTLNFTAP